MTMPRRGRPSGRSAKPRKPVATARHLAYDVLTAWQERGVFASIVLDELCRARRVDPRERAMALDLSYTAIRRQATIDAVVAAFVERDRVNIEEGLWRVLQVGVCQLLFMDNIPPHAAVHESTEVTKHIAKQQWTGMVNAVLRSISKSIDEAGENDPATHCVPVGASGYRSIGRAVLPDPSVDQTEHFAKGYSFPRWLMRDWLEERGPEETERHCRWFNMPPVSAVRVNVLKDSADNVQQALADASVAATQGELPESLIPETSFNPKDIPGFTEGAFSIQDVSAMSASRLLNPKPKDRVLDLCAAPGGKTMHLAELIGNNGTIVATDSDDRRLRLVTQSAERLGHTCIQTCRITEKADNIPGGQYDAVLVDVPCSNTGVLGKRPEARWRITPESTRELIAIQLRLLEKALDVVKPGGAVVYSTCSIDARENRGVVDEILKSRPSVQVEQEIHHTPGQPGDGGYQARLLRP